MKIIIKFYSGFENYTKNRLNEEVILQANDKTDIKSVIKIFLPADIISFVGMVLVNKKIVNFDYKVKDGDMIEVFPLLGGG